MIDKVQQHIASRQKEYLERLQDFLRIPSISTDAQGHATVRKAGEWVRDLLSGCGIKAEILETGKHPAIFADTGPAQGKGPTVLLYGHYDVQPVGEVAKWQSPPFEPTIRDGRIYARGSADDKGQVLTHLLAAEAWMKVAGKLPSRVKFLIEGEEEIGSPNLESIIRKNKERLACDYVALSDTAKLDDQTPAICYGTKGLVYKEVRVYGPSHDLHSGVFGGTLANPGNELARIIASFHDANRRVTIPGFYDDVVEVSPEEAAKLKQVPFDEEAYRKEVGSSTLVGEAGYSTLMRRWVRPTCDVNGMFGGYMGPGSSTIIPAWCGAKVSMRLVPNQDHVKIGKLFDEYVKKAAGPNVKVEIDTHSSCNAYMCPIDSPGAKAAAKAVEAGFGRPAMFIREGGSLPILPMFREVLGADSIMMGFSVPGCNLHSPNEFLVLEDFYAGIRTSAHFYQTIAAA